MTTLLTSTTEGVAVQQTTSAGKVGRWCAPPQVPDECYFCLDVASWSRPAAVGWIEIDGWRYGVCAGCAPTVRP